MKSMYILCKFKGVIHCVAGPVDECVIDELFPFFQDRFPFLRLYISDHLPNGVSIPYMDQE